MADAEYDNLDLLLCRYLDGDLSRREQAKLEARLADEPALREELRLYASLDGHLPDLAGEAPAGVDYVRQRADIMAAVEREALLAAAPRRLLFRPAALGALAAAAAVLMIVSAGLLYLLATPGARPTVYVPQAAGGGPAQTPKPREREDSPFRRSAGPWMTRRSNWLRR